MATASAPSTVSHNSDLERHSSYQNSIPFPRREIAAAYQGQLGDPKEEKEKILSHGTEWVEKNHVA